jgi:eukaryotic-like serine/threonine-protein kinase
MAGETILNNRYELVAQQGSGGMSVVYKARDLSLGRLVAVKILRPSLTKDLSFLDKFQNEARNIAKLSHPNIVTVHDVGHEQAPAGEIHYMVMELVDGQDLKKIIKTGGAMPIADVLHTAIQTAQGLAFAHKAYLVHADVKPQNLLVTPARVVKITDFGIAQALSDTQPYQQRTEVVWGSPHYFAPEQARGERPTPASDVYSLGIVMFEMLTGQLPFVGASQQDLAMAHIRADVPRVDQLNPAVPAALANIVYRAMAKEPRSRYSADQVASLLEGMQKRMQNPTLVDVAESGPMTGPSTPPPVTPNPPSYAYPAAGGMGAASSEPTARYSAAPYAPQAPSYGPVGQPAGVPQTHGAGYSPGVPPPAGPPTAGPGAIPDSGSFYRPASPVDFRTPAPDPRRDSRSGIDPVSIVLGIIAFIAIMGLIPLFLAVAQARAG